LSSLRFSSDTHCCNARENGLLGCGVTISIATSITYRGEKAKIPKGVAIGLAVVAARLGECCMGHNEWAWDLRSLVTNDRMPKHASAA